MTSSPGSKGGSPFLYLDGPCLGPSSVGSNSLGSAGMYIAGSSLPSHGILPGELFAFAWDLVLPFSDLAFDSGRAMIK
jgi:hypothetical protein